MTSDTFEAADIRLGQLRIHVAHPAQNSRAGVLLYPTIRGLDDTMRESAQVFADAGMCAVVWDPYNGEDVTGDVMHMLARSKECEDESMVRDLRSVVDYMQGELELASIAGIGWCFGGRVALIHGGSDERIRAVSAYHPTLWLDTPIDFAGRSLSIADFPEETLDVFALAASINGPVQICHPERDFTPQAAYDRLLEALRTRPEPTIYEFYPGADHGFSFALGTANEKAQRFAWAITLSLFSQCL